MAFRDRRAEEEQVCGESDEEASTFSQTRLWNNQAQKDGVRSPEAGGALVFGSDEEMKSRRMSPRFSTFSPFGRR